jgi:hypothetical protein
VGITTRDKLDIEVGSLEKIILREVGQHPVHWGWWVFWLVFFWPCLIIVGILSLFRKQYLVRLIYKPHKGVSLTKDVFLDQQNYQALQHKAQELNIPLKEGSARA